MSNRELVVQLRREKRMSAMGIIRETGIPHSSVYRYLAGLRLTPEENLHNLRESFKTRRKRPRQPPKVRLESKRECQRAWYSRNKKKQSGWVRQRIRRIRIAVRSLKVKCLYCSESEPICLDFHHRDKTGKNFTINAAFRAGWALARILEEVKKCDIVCSNCHRKIHGGVAEWKKAPAF